MSETQDVDFDARSADFRTMADRIDANRDAPFGGAFVLVSPDGTVRSSLMLDSAEHAGLFWAQVKSIADIALTELQQDANRQNAGWGRR